MNFLTNINLGQNELQNAKIQNLATAPENPVAGQVYFNTATNKYMGYNGAKWVDLGYEHPSTHTIAQISGLQSALDGKSATSHNHDSAYKPASYVPAWGEVTGKPSTFTPASHTHAEYANQNAFSNVKVGSTTIAADTATDVLEIVAGSNIVLTPDATTDKLTIAANVPAHPSGLHVTQAEKDGWNAKESTSGSQAKADKALADAKTYANQKVAALVGSAPEALDTLQELAAAVEGNQAGVTDLLEQVGKKADTTYVNTELGKKANSSHTHDYAPTTHNHNASQITAMTGYAKATAVAAIGTADTLNIAIGKLEKALDGKQASGSYASASHNHDSAYKPASYVPAWADVTGKPSTFAPAGHNQASNTINAMTGYAKAETASAIAVADTLNVAIGKLEKALDGKQASGSYAASNHNHDANYLGKTATAAAATKLATARTINGVAFDGTANITVADSTKVAPTGTIVANRIAVFNDTTGKVIKDSGFTIATSVPSGAKFTDTVYTHPTNHPASVITQDANNRFVTDAEKSNWNGKAAGNHNHNGTYTRKYAANIGNGTLTTIRVTHNLASEDVTVLVKEVASKQVIFTDIQIIDANNIDILFASAPAANAYRVVVTG